MQHGNDRHANVDLAAADGQSDASVLRQPFFRDVHAGHDFESADDRRAKSLDFGRHGLDLQHAIHAKANLQICLFRFDMNIAGLLFDGFQQQFVDQFDNGRRLGCIADFIARNGLQRVDFFFRHRHQFLHGATPEAQCIFQESLNLFGRSNNRVQIQAGTDRKFLQCSQVERVSDGHNGSVAIATEWQDAFAEQILNGEQLQQLQIHSVLFQIHAEHAKSGCQLPDGMQVIGVGNWSDHGQEFQAGESVC